MSLPLIRHSIRRKDLDFLLESVLQDRLVSGIYSEKLSKVLRESLGLQSVSLFASTSNAIACVLESLSLRAGDRVVLPVLAPPYWRSGLESQGIECVWADVEADSPVLAAAAVSSLGVSAVRAVVVCSTLGYVADLSALGAAGVPIIHDISQGLGGTYQDSVLGRLGDVVLASFGSDSLLAGPGGCAVGLRLGALEQPLPWEQMSDVVSSLLLSQWADVEALAEGKRTNFRLLYQRLSRHYRQPKQLGDSVAVGPYFCVLADSGAKEILAFAHRNAVEADWAFRDQVGGALTLPDGEFPHGRHFLQHTLAFPLYSTFGAKELENLSRVLASLP